jgi:NAD+ kinase
VRKLHRIAAKLGIEILAETAPDKPDFHLVLGGDGSVLRAVHTVPDLRVPLVNINIGSLGYLTCAGLDDLERVLQALKDGHYKLTRRSLLEARCLDADGRPIAASAFALNDLVAMRADSGRIVGIGLAVDGVHVTTFLCDGLIVSTPTGSTAYSLSAGGPIILPDTAAIGINVMYPHTLTSRPLVLPEKARITLRILRNPSPLSFSADGRVHASLNTGDRIEIRLVRRRQARLVMLPEHNDFATLRLKLNWNGALIS